MSSTQKQAGAAPKAASKSAPKAQTRTQAKKSREVATQTSQSIESQTEAFLKSGGKIQKIDSGISGQNFMAGNKHIRLGK